MNSDQMLLLIRTLDHLNEFFAGNEQKVSLWMITKNQHLGDTAPITFFLIDRGHKVHNFVVSSIEENKCPHGKKTHNSIERCFECFPNIGLKEGEK